MVEFRGQWPVPELSWDHRCSVHVYVCECVCVCVWECIYIYMCVCVCVCVCFVYLLPSLLGKGNQFPCSGDLICRSRAQDGFITGQIDHCHTHPQTHAHRGGNLYEVKWLVKWQSCGVDLEVPVVTSTSYLLCLPDSPLSFHISLVWTTNPPQLTVSPLYLSLLSCSLKLQLFLSFSLSYFFLEHLLEQH